MALLSFRLASAGSGPERYTLQIPFQFGPGDTLKDDTRGRDNPFGDYHIEVVENQGIELLRVTGFRTQDEAAAFLPKLHGALLRLTVLKRLSLRAVVSLQTPTLHDPPKDIRGNPNFGTLMDNRGWTHLDGWLDPVPAVVIPEHLRLLEFGAGSVNVIRSMPTTMFISVLQDGLRLPYPENVALDEHLALAIDLYAASVANPTHAARVIGLATVLEALLHPENAKPVVVMEIEHLLNDLDSRRAGREEIPEDRDELDRLRSRLNGLREESISRRLRTLVGSIHHVLGETSDEADRNIRRTYGTRSNLLHDGHADSADISRAADWLQRSVPLILEALISQATQACHTHDGHNRAT